jgi:hypothetical protein
MSKERPTARVKVWVNVIHTNKTIQFFLNRSPLRGDGSFMSLEYFGVYKGLQDLSGYRYLNSKYDILDTISSFPQFDDSYNPTEEYNDDDYDY